MLPINPTVNVLCCGGISHGCNAFAINEVKQRVDFHLEDIPFRSDSKITHVICATCKLHTASIFENPAFIKATLTAAAYLREQDTQYSVPDSSPIIPINGYVSSDRFAAPVNSKRWITGAITYDFYDTNGHGFGREPFLIYATDERAVEIAIAQFVRPPVFKGITNVRVGV